MGGVVSKDPIEYALERLEYKCLSPEDRERRDMGLPTSYEKQRDEEQRRKERNEIAWTMKYEKQQREAKRKAEEEAKRKAEEEARRQEAEAKRKAEAEAKRKAEEEARRQEADAKRKAEEAARRKAEAEARRQEAEARRKAQEEASKREAACAEVGLPPTASDAELAQRTAELEAKRKIVDGDLGRWFRSIGFEGEELEELVGRFITPGTRIEVKDLRTLFALDAEDIDEVLLGYPLGKRKVIKKAIHEEQN